jgi:hypothetical protein
MEGQKSGSKAAASNLWNDWLVQPLRRFNASLGLTLAGTLGFWVALYKYDQKLTELMNIHWGRVALAIVVPIGVCLLAFVLPNWLRRRRDESLKEWAIKGQPEHGYFRLAPYDEADHQRFKRADGAHIEVAEWLEKRASGPLLYLTGRSGTGKSSMLSAYVLPKLREGKPPSRTVTVRASGDAVAALVAELHKPGLVYDHPPKDLPREILLLLPRISDRLRDRGERLLIVLDQFEEFLIAHGRDPEQLGPIAELLQLVLKCSSEPFERVRFLLVLRSEYQMSLYDLSLPRLHEGVNWMEAGPFSEEAAQVFLKGAPKLELGSKLLETLVRRASDLDGTPGQVRPIVINMIGRAIEARHPSTRVGQQIGKRQAERLLIDFVHAGLCDRDARDHAPAVLGQMITPEGTKTPKAVCELADLTKLVPKVVAGCLGCLAHRFGLVRQLRPEDSGPVEQQHWEVAHDFLARLLSLVLPTWRPSFWTRYRPWLAPALMVLAIAAIPLTLEGIHRYRLSKLRRWAEDYHLDLTEMTRGQYYATPRTDPQRVGDNASPRPPMPLPEAIRRAVGEGIAELIGGLDISKNGWADLPPEIGQLRWLTALNASGNNLMKLPPEFAELRLLRELNLAGNEGLKKVPPEVFQLPELAALDLARTELDEIPPEIARLSNLSKLHMPRNRVKKLPPQVGQLVRLTSLHVSRNPYLTELPPEIGQVPELTELHVSNCKLARLPREIGQLRHLTLLQLSFNELTELPPEIGELRELRSLDLVKNKLKELPPQIAQLTKLNYLDLRENPLTAQSPGVKLVNRTVTAMYVDGDSPGGGGSGDAGGGKGGGGAGGGKGGGDGKGGGGGKGRGKGDGGGKREGDGKAEDVIQVGKDQAP